MRACAHGPKNWGDVTCWRYFSFLAFEITLNSQKYIMEIKECSKQFFLKILPKNIFLDKKKKSEFRFWKKKKSWDFDFEIFSKKFKKCEFLIWDSEILRFSKKKKKKRWDFDFYIFFSRFSDFENFRFFFVDLSKYFDFSLCSMFHNLNIFNTKNI